MTTDLAALPLHMCDGSRGPFVNGFLLVLKTLYGADLFSGRNPSGIDFDATFSDVGIKTLQDVQHTYGWYSSEDFGPRERELFKDEFDISVEDIAGLFPGTTIFVQPDGTELTWTSPSATQSAAGVSDLFTQGSANIS